MDPYQKAKSLSCWQQAVEPLPVSGGITNANFVVAHRGANFFVRIGDDIPVHGVMRFNELAASRAAHAAGISPWVVHHEPGAIVFDFIEGHTLEAEEVRDPVNLERIVSLIRRCHRDLPRHFRGPALVFWVFQVVRDYAHTLVECDSRMLARLPRLIDIAGQLELAIGAVELVFGHNDLLAGNFIDDGARLWLFDWDYAGFNSPLFDLGGLASNNELSVEQEQWLLEAYFGKPADADLRRRYEAMKCASLLRESMWSMVSEIHLDIDFDYVAYTRSNLARFEHAWADFEDAYS